MQSIVFKEVMIIRSRITVSGYPDLEVYVDKAKAIFIGRKDTEITVWINNKHIDHIDKIPLEITNAHIEMYTDEEELILLLYDDKQQQIKILFRNCEYAHKICVPIDIIKELIGI